MSSQPTYNLYKDGNSQMPCMKIHQYQNPVFFVSKALGAVKSIFVKAPENNEIPSLKRRSIIVINNESQKSVLVVAVDRTFIEEMSQKELQKEDRRALSQSGNEFLVYIDPTTSKMRCVGESDITDFCLKYPVRDIINLDDLQCITDYASPKKSAHIHESSLKITALCTNAELMSESQINALYNHLLKTIDSLKGAPSNSEADEKKAFLKHHINMLNECFEGPILKDRKIVRIGSLFDF